MSSDASQPPPTAERSPASRGTLFVCATPIGNLEDLSPRALGALEGAEVIAAERPVHTRKLLARHGIPAWKLRPAGEGASAAEREAILRALRDGRDVVLVSDAGTPGISDPGAQLVRLAAEEGLAVRPIPGPSSVTAALSVAGFAFEWALFVGFPPRKPGERERALRAALAVPAALVLFESPQRVRATLERLGHLCPSRAVCILREATKLHEEVLRGAPGEVLAALPAEPVGEFTIVVSPPGEADEEQGAQDKETELRERIIALHEEGVAFRGLVRALVLFAGLSRSAATRLVRRTIPEEDESRERDE